MNFCCEVRGDAMVVSIGDRNKRERVNGPKHVLLNLTINNDGSKLHLQWSSAEIENEKKGIS